MKRWPFRILLCLILLTGGAITTVAVAWGCGLIPRFSLIEEWDGFNGGSRFRSDIYRSIGALRVVTAKQLDHYGNQEDAVLRTRILQMELCLVAMGDSSFGERIGYPSLVAPIVFPDSDVVLVEYRLGWPALALHCHIEQRYANKAAVTNAIVLNIPQEASNLLFARVLPVRLLCPGFVIDTLFYAAILFGLFFGFASAKRAVRRRRGRCPRCGYDLRGALENGCSECGWGR